MDLMCPNCDNTLTPSVVGYLCVGCGESISIIAPMMAPQSIQISRESQSAWNQANRPNR